MYTRIVPRIVAFTLPLLATLMACVSSTQPDAGVAAAPDSGPIAPSPGADATAPDASFKDASAMDARAIDAADAMEAADASDAAVTTTLPFGTGLDATGTPLADGLIDGHWTVRDGASNALTAYVQTDALGYSGYWMRPSATSKFISPFIDTVDPSGNGTFTYTTTFTLRSGVDAGAVALVIRCASDNGMTGATLNGEAIAGVVGGSYSTFQTLNVTGPFVAGTNTVELVVSNGGGPTGLRAELDLTAN